MKKRIAIISILILLTLSFISVYMAKNNDKSYILKHDEVKDNSRLSIMVETSEGSGNYSKDNSFDWTTGDYELNLDKSSCTNNSTLNWDDNNYQVSINGNKSDSCTLFFKKAVQIVVTSSDVSAVYDGVAKTLDLSTNIPSATAYYSTKELTESNYKSEGSTSQPSVVNAGTTTVYWCVEYNTKVKCGRNDITIAKANATINFTSGLDIKGGGSYSGSTTYEYTGDGVISCSSNTSSVTCTVDSQTNTITIKVPYKCDFNINSSQITINASEGLNSLATSDIITFAKLQCLDPETLVDYWDKKRKKKLKKKIKGFKSGDIVYSYDYASDKVITRKVTKVTVNKANEIYHLILDDEEIKITGDHPVCVDGAGYLNVSQLKPGYKLLAQDGSSYEIKDIYVEILDKEQDMYCLELENGTSLSIGQKGLICLSMFVSTSFAMMTKTAALVGVVYESYSYICAPDDLI